MSIWHSLTTDEPIRDMDGFDLDVAITRDHPEHGEAVRVSTVTVAGVEFALSVEHAARLRNALTEAINTLAKG